MRRITHVCLPNSTTKAGHSQSWWLQIDKQDRIVDLGVMPNGSAMAGESWRGDVLSPMGVDLQINGGFGLPFPELTEAALPQLLQLLDQLWRDGVEAISPTLVTCSVEPLRRALAVLRQARGAHQPYRCQLLGAHLEGPFLADARRGAHPRQHLASPTMSELKARISGFEHEIALVTLAPELDGAAALIEHLCGLGIRVALGHSTADATTANEAFERGVTMLTHSFNAMQGLHHRNPGPIGAACQRDDIALGLIADGVHVDPTMAVLLQRLAGDQLVLVSDALAPYGLEDGVHHWDERALLVADGTCRLEDGTLAGVTLPLLEGVKRLARWSAHPSASIYAATVAPRKVLNSQATFQLLGRPLNELLRWHWDAETNNLSWQHAD
ncbi:MAG: N-acetylglucosamine-6-phosphate deacetylase [Synechococcus sp. ArSW.bin.68]|jgi:N-acetylglucosamine-6-phosphate deacetylase